MPRRSVQILTRAYYVLAALILGGIAVSPIWSAVSARSHGCQVVFSQSDIVEPPIVGPIPGGLPACQQYVAILPIVVGLAACVVVLAAAIRFGHIDRWSRLVVGVGALVGVAVSAGPMALIWWVSDYYNDSLPDALGLLLGAPPLLVGLGAAWVTWRLHSRPEPSAQPSPA